MANPPENAIALIEVDDATYYMCQNGSELAERKYNGQLSPNEPVGPAKPKTRGAYVLFEEKRAFFCLRDGDVLQDFTFDDEEEAWSPGELASLGIAVAPDAGIAASYATADGGILVFYKHPTGGIQSFRKLGESSWTSVDSLPSTQPSEQAGIYAREINGSIHVFYTCQDTSIHDLVLNNGRWSDTLVDHSLTKYRAQKKNLVADVMDDGEIAVQFEEADGKVYAIHTGTLTYLGWYDQNGEWHDSDSAQGYNSKGAKKLGSTRKS